MHRGGGMCVVTSLVRGRVLQCETRGEGKRGEVRREDERRREERNEYGRRVP